MNKVKIFCFGFGQVAEGFINKLIKEKIDLDLSITSRQESHQVNFNGLTFSSYKFDEDKIDNELKIKLDDATYILISIPPINGDDQVIKYFENNFANNKNCKWITYLSATSVYGDHQGEWVNETSDTKPTSINGVNRLKAENSWKNLSSKYKLPLQIFRLAGIYSNELNILKRLKIGEVQLVNKKNHFFSRIHVEDISNILFKSMSNFKNNETYNISDDMPASQMEVAEYGAKLLKLKKPTPIKLENLKNEMLKNFYKDSKNEIFF